MCFRRRRVGALIVIAAAAFTLAVAPSPGVAGSLDACAQRVIRDWYTGGRIDGAYPLACYRAAIRALPDDVLQYSNADQDIRRALAFARRGKERPGEQGNRSCDPRHPRRRIGRRPRRSPRGRRRSRHRRPRRHPIPPPSRTRPRRPSARRRSSPRPARRRRPCRIRSSRSLRSRGSCSSPAASAGSPAAAAERVLRTGRITVWSARGFFSNLQEFPCRPILVLAWPVRSQDALERARRGVVARRIA